MFNIVLLDKDFKKIKVVVNFINVLWTERFLIAGAFEVQAIGITQAVLQEAKYIYKSNSEYIGEITSYDLTDIAILKGSFLENKLKTRFCIDYKSYSGNAETVIRDMVYDMCIVGDRAIDRLELSPTNNNKGGYVILNMFGKNLQEEVQKLQTEHALSIKMKYDFDIGKIIFSVWQGVDKRDSSPRVQGVKKITLSRTFDNVLSERYTIEAEDVKNYIIIDGAGEGTARKRVIIDETNGRPRNELYVDARDVQPTAGQSELQYLEALRQRGIAKKLEFIERQTIEVTINTPKVPTLEMGDIITYRNTQYNVIAEGQVTEFQDVAGSEIKKNIIIGKERIQIIQRLRRGM